MTRIGLLSDSHGYLDLTLREHFNTCDEIWHAGDIGSLEILHQLQSWGKTTRVVFGNIDDHEIRSETPEDLWFTCEDVIVFITHIAGYPGRYNTRVMKLISEKQPAMVVCGHSHILKVIFDKQWNHLHINPGASGQQGLHQIRTAIRFVIDGKDIKDMQVIELGKRGTIRDQ